MPAEELASAARVHGEPGTRGAPASRAAANWALDASRLAFLWVAGADMRMAVLALPPVLPEVRRALHLNEGTVGFLTTLPVLLLALGAVGGSAAVARLGVRRALALGLTVVGTTSALRGAGGVPALLAASVGLGAGIAILQPAMPTMTRLWFPSRVGFATSIYTNGIVAGEAAAASLTIPLVLPLAGSWQVSLTLWGLPALAAAALLAAPFARLPPRVPHPTADLVRDRPALAVIPEPFGATAAPATPAKAVAPATPTTTPATPTTKPATPTTTPATPTRDPGATGRTAVAGGTGPRPRSRWWPEWDDAVTWRVGLLQGGGSVVYFGTNAYLSTELHATGHGSLVAACLGALNSSQLLASVVVALLARTKARPRSVLAACGIAALLGLAALVCAPSSLAIAGCALIGISSAICFVVSLALPPLLVPPEEVHKMAAATTTIGYVAAFALPLAGGFAWDATGHPALAFSPAAAGAVALGLALAWPGRSARKLAGVRLR